MSAHKISRTYAKYQKMQCKHHLPQTIIRLITVLYLIFLSFFFYSLLFRDASTSLVISRLGSLGVYQKAVYFYSCVVNVSFVKFTDFNFMLYEFDE